MAAPGRTGADNQHIDGIVHTGLPLTLAEHYPRSDS